MGKPVRMADIAKKLNISVVSVSKALSGKRGVSEEMRAKVAALAKEMGYEGVRTVYNHGTGGNIGVLVPDRFYSGNGFYTSLYRFLALKSSAEGLTCMMEIVSAEAERSTAVPSLIAGKKVEAIIFMGNFDAPYVRAVAEKGLPFILLDFHIPGYAKNCVTSDNLDGGFLLTRYLLETGRREIGFVGSIWATSSIMGRYLGYQWALQTEGLTPKKEWLLEDRDKNGILVPMVLPDTLPQAFLCSCDAVAYYLIETLRRAGKRVPEDVAVCGYDDIRTPLSAQIPLTTYRVDIERMANVTINQLLRKIRQEQTDTVFCTIPGQMIVREST